MKVKDLQAELARFNPDSHITIDGVSDWQIQGQEASHHLIIVVDKESANKIAQLKKTISDLKR